MLERRMTPKKAEHYIGREVEIEVTTGMFVTCLVEDHRHVWGKNQFLLAPKQARGGSWFDMGSIKWEVRK